MSNKHTPGPWRVEADTRLVWGHCDPTDRSSRGYGYPVAEAQRPRRWQKQQLPTDSEIEANARLIAAAPDLLAALEAWSNSAWLAGIEPDAGSNDPIAAMLARTRAAIAAATGKDAP